MRMDGSIQKVILLLGAHFSAGVQAVIWLYFNHERTWVLVWRLWADVSNMLSVAENNRSQAGLYKLSDGVFLKELYGWNQIDFYFRGRLQQVNS